MRKVFIAFAAGALLLAGCGGRSVIPAGNFAGSTSSIGHGVHTSAMTITETPVPQASSGPTGVTMGPDGNVWFTETNLNQLGRVNVATGTIVEVPLPTAGSGPFGITTGPDNLLWFVESKANKVAKYSP